MAFRTLVALLGILGLGLSASAQEAVFADLPDSRNVRVPYGQMASTGVEHPGYTADPHFADCDGNGILDVADYICFLERFASGDLRADCDRSGVVDFLDLQCFNEAFIAGASWSGAAQPPLDKAAIGEWCLTHQRYIAELQATGGHVLDAGCVQRGPCDDPEVRNTYIPDASTPIKTYRLYFNVFCENNGSNCVATTNDVAVAVNRLNDNFAPWRIQFVYEARFVNNTRFRNLDTGDEWHMKNRFANSPDTQLNVYIVNTGAGGVSWATYPWWDRALDKQGGIVQHYQWFVEGSIAPLVLTHEVGHCLGLYHTFHGVDEVTQCGDCYEHAGRSPEEGDVTGDRCSDTQPTPRNNNQCSDPAEPDVCTGNHWLDTPILNYMGYSRPCRNEFTPQQAGRMHCWTEDRLSGWLVQPSSPEPPAAPGTPELTQIGDGQILIEWADNSHDEEGFEVARQERSGNSWSSPVIIADLEANTTMLIDAPGSGRFRYSVRAYNAIGASAWSTSGQIRN